MELLILLVAVISLTTNVYLVRKLSGLHPGFVELEVEAFDPGISEPPPPVIETVAPDPVVPVVSNESSMAWRNATGLPAAGPASSSRHQPLPPSGPLERPYGFV